MEETITKTFLKNYSSCSISDNPHHPSPRNEEASGILLSEIERKRINLSFMITLLVQEFESETQTGIRKLSILKSEHNKISTRYIIPKIEIW